MPTRLVTYDGLLISKSLFVPFHAFLAYLSSCLIAQDLGSRVFRTCSWQPSRIRNWRMRVQQFKQLAWWTRSLYKNSHDSPRFALYGFLLLIITPGMAVCSVYFPSDFCSMKIVCTYSIPNHHFTRTWTNGLLYKRYFCGIYNKLWSLKESFASSLLRLGNWHGLQGVFARN